MGTWLGSGMLRNTAAYVAYSGKESRFMILQKLQPLLDELGLADKNYDNAKKDLQDMLRKVIELLQQVLTSVE